MRGKGRRKRPHPAQLNSRPYGYGGASEAMSHNIYPWCTVKFQLRMGAGRPRRSPLYVIRQSKIDAALRVER